MNFLESIKSIPITNLAQRMGYTLVKKGHYYSLKEHDSVIIDTEKNCFWRNSRFVKGRKGSAGSTIDFVMEFYDEPDCKSAMRRIALMYGIEDKKFAYKTEKSEAKFQKKLVLPQKGKNNNDVFNYLAKRGISTDVIRYFYARQMLYEDTKKNCIFVSPTKEFACIRSTGSQRFVRDCEGSNYDQCFFFNGSENAKILIVAESVIDIMSIMTYIQMKGKWYGNYAYLALAGTNKVHALFVHLDKALYKYNKVWLCFDADEAGSVADINAINGMKEMGFEGEWDIKKAPKGKDWNDYIKMLSVKRKDYKK